MSYVCDRAETPWSYLPGGPVLLTGFNLSLCRVPVTRIKLISAVCSLFESLFRPEWWYPIKMGGHRGAVLPWSWIRDASQELPVRVTLLGDGTSPAWQISDWLNAKQQQRLSLWQDGLSYELNKRWYENKENYYTILGCFSNDTSLCHAENNDISNVIINDVNFSAHNGWCFNRWRRKVRIPKTIDKLGRMVLYR